MMMMTQMLVMKQMLVMVRHHHGFADYVAVVMTPVFRQRRTMRNRTFVTASTTTMTASSSANHDTDERKGTADDNNKVDPAKKKDPIHDVMDIPKVRDLLNSKIHPLGSFTIIQWQEAKNILDKVRETKIVNKDVVFYSIRLLERMVWELGSDTHNDETRTPGLFICQPSYYNPILIRWRAAWIRKRKVFKPQIVLMILRASTQFFEGFKYDKETLHILMNAAIKRSARRKAPKAAQEWLDTIEEVAEVTENPQVQPDLTTFLQLLKAWDQSRLPEAGERMDDLVQYIRTKKKLPVNVVVYNILIRYWADKAKTEHIEQLLRVMKEQDELEPSSVTLAHVAYGYVWSGNIEPAEMIVRDLLVWGPKNDNEWELVGQCTQQILLAYRRIIMSEKRTVPVKALAAERANKFYFHVHDKLSDGVRQRKLTLTLMDMFLRTDQRERAEALAFANVTPERLTLLVKALGKHDLADRAAQLFDEIMEQDQIEPDLQLLNALLKAWALSTRPDSLVQAFKTFDFLENDQRCRNLHPNDESYNALLECLSVSKKPDVGERAMKILDEMEMLHREGVLDVKPNLTSFNLAIRACLRAKNESLADDLLRRMEESQQIIPERSTFTEYFNYCSNMASAKAGERAMQLLDQMRQNADKFGNKFLSPDVHCYNLAITTCTRDYRKHQDISALERAWEIYQQMLSIEDRKRYVRPDHLTFTRLLTTFTKVKDEEWMQKADEVLLEYSKSHYRGLRPSEQHFDIVIDGWNAIGNTEEADSWRVVKVKVLKNVSYAYPLET